MRNQAALHSRLLSLRQPPDDADRHLLLADLVPGTQARTVELAAVALVRPPTRATEPRRNDQREIVGMKLAKAVVKGMAGTEAAAATVRVIERIVLSAAGIDTVTGSVHESVTGSVIGIKSENATRTTVTATGKGTGSGTKIEIEIVTAEMTRIETEILAKSVTRLIEPR